MSCNHANPPEYLFCGTCGEALNRVRCRCGSAVAAGDSFCGRCGASVAEIETGDGSPAVADDLRLDLEKLAKLAAQEKQFLETTDKARVTQDDIRKLLVMRRKKF